MPDHDPTTAAWDAALRLLSASAKSRRELGERLRRKGFSVRIVESTLERLVQKGLLDDRAMAEGLIVRLSHERLAGRHKISFELKRRGIDPALRDELVAGLDVQNERERARELARSRWQRYSRLDPAKRRKKIFDFLVRRGFDLGVARSVMQAFAPEPEDE